MQDITPTQVVLKSSGLEEIFSSDKLAQSLHKAGATRQTIGIIVNDVRAWLSPGVTTKQIYKRAYAALHKIEKTSFRYRLKQAIFDLGPTGYPFELFIGELYKKQGWQVEVGQVLQGQFVTHEMDVIANKAKQQHLVECKYHKDQGKQVSIQVPLYVRSRVNDIIEYRQLQPVYKGVTFVGSVVTNTRFSLDAVTYGSQCGLKMLSWNYPEGNALKEQIEKFRIYPITILKQLSQKDKQCLLNKRIVLCSQLQANPSLLIDMKFSHNKYKALIKELEQICACTSK